MSELTTETTTTIPTAAVVSHFKIISAIASHNVFDDLARNGEHGIKEFCDNLFINRSIYWRRSGWYRIMEGAEYLKPEKAIVPFYCGAYSPGW